MKPTVPFTVASLCALLALGQSHVCATPTMATVSFNFDVSGYFKAENLTASDYGWYGAHFDIRNSDGSLYDQWDEFVDHYQAGNANDGKVIIYWK